MVDDKTINEILYCICHHTSGQVDTEKTKLKLREKGVLEPLPTSLENARARQLSHAGFVGEVTYKIYSAQIKYYEKAIDEELNKRAKAQNKISDLLIQIKELQEEK